MDTKVIEHFYKSKIMLRSKNIRHLIFLFLSLIILVSCGPQPRELAVKKINLGKMILVQGDTARAIEIFDSIKVLYPSAEVQVGVAKNILSDLYRQMIDDCMSQIEITDSIISVYEKNFKKEKGEYDKYVQYTPKRQTFNRSWDRSFLQVYLDERGEFYLISNYMGKEWMKHTGIRVYDKKLQAKSERVPLDDPDNHRSDFLDYKWEKVSYREGKSDSVINFIVEHPDLKIKCVFMGSDYYYILLEDYDIKAVVDAYHLSNAIKRKKALEEKLKRLKEQQLL